jgi:hypothetical protein
MEAECAAAKENSANPAVNAAMRPALRTMLVRRPSMWSLLFLAAGRRIVTGQQSYANFRSKVTDAVLSNDDIFEGTDLMAKPIHPAVANTTCPNSLWTIAEVLDGVECRLTRQQDHCSWNRDLCRHKPQ